MSARKLLPRYPFVMGLHLLLLGFALSGSTIWLAGQTKPPAPASSAASIASVQEFPVTMRQNVKAGTTPPGTKVEAKLTMATLVSGAVIPAGAIFSGEVVVSVEKSASDPSRIAIRMDSVHWKNESKPIKLYLIPWYYPLQMGQDADHDRDDCQSASGIGIKCPTGVGTPSTRFPSETLPPPPSMLSTSRVAMKDVESVRAADGTIELTSTHSNIKLDKTTTYVLATGELTMGKSK